MGLLYQRDKNQIDIKIEFDGENYILKSDRMFASFPDKDKMETFSRKQFKFLSKLHHRGTANYLGLFICFGDGFGTGQSSSQLMIYTEAMTGEANPHNPLLPLVDGATEDDVADSWILMRRKWVDRDFVGEMDGTYESFRKFVLDNTEWVEFGDGDGNDDKS